MRHQLNDLIVVSVLAVACAAIALVMPAVPILRAIAALPLVLVLPGYALLTACLPAHTFGRVEQTLFSLGLSIAITILLSLGLYWLGIHLQLVSWTMALVLTTVIACGIAWRRRRTTQEEVSASNLSLNLSWRDIILMGAAVVVGGVAIGIARLPTPPTTVSGYTSLWMIPTGEANAGNYQVGISSQEFVTITYHLQVTVDGQIVQDWPELKLSPGETWTGSIGLAADRVNAKSIEAVLFRSDNPMLVYRQVKLQRNG